MRTATYTKLRDGTWGIRVVGSDRPAPGATVEVLKQSGERKQECVARVVWAGSGMVDGRLCDITICSVGGSAASKPSSSGSRRRSGPYECEECGERVYPGSSCWETGARH